MALSSDDSDHEPNSIRLGNRMAEEGADMGDCIR